MINRQDSRHRIKRSNLTGVVPTAHTASTDFTDGTWLNTDIREAEFFYNIPDKKLWIGTGTSSIEIAQIGSTTSGNSLEQTLAIGNDSGVNSIIMGTATSIKSENGGGQIDLDYFSSSGEVSITTDNGGQGESYLYITPTDFTLSNQFGNISSKSSGIRLNHSSKVAITTGKVFTLYGSFNGSTSLDVILVKDNFSTPSNSSWNDMPSVFIGSQNSTIEAGVYNSVVLGGNTITASYSNSVYVPDLYIQSGKSIKSTNGGQLDLDISSATNSVMLSNDNGLASKAYLYLLDNTALLGVPNSSISLDNGISISSPTASVTVSSSSGFVNINNRIFKATSTSNATAATSTLASISMSNNQTLTIQVVLNAYCASPNRNLGITMMASFLKYGGTIYQNGTTNLITKDGFGDGTTGTIDTDGTNVRIRITNGAGLTTSWGVSYDYLLTT